MGFIRRKVTKRVLCNHLGSFGDYCRKCGAKKNRYGFGYESKWIDVEEEITELCTHLGEFGTYCSKCGDKIKFF